MRFTIVAVAVCVGALPPAFAQAPADPFKGKAALGYLATSGSTESTNANASVGVELTRDAWAHEFDASAVTASNNDVKTAEAYKAAYEARRTFGQRKRS
jgi:putative salt-induced outer membrane protein